MWYARLILIFLLSTTAGCGFKPVHRHADTSDSNQSKVNTFLGQIEVLENTSNITNQMFISSVSKKLAPFYNGQEKKYTLKLNAEINNYELAVQQDREVTRYNQKVTAYYSLTDRINSKVIFQGKTNLTGSYDLTESEYATLIAERDTGKRIIEQLGDEVKARLTQFYIAEYGL